MKKVSVGEVKDVGVSPKRGRKKGFMILIIVAVILIALFLIGNTGCSNKKSSTTTPTATIMPIPDRVSGLESRVTYLEQHPNSFDATTLWTTVNALHNYDDAPLIARLGILEALNISALQTQLTELNASLAWLSLRLESHLAIPTPTPTPVSTATPTPIGSTPTPTPSVNTPPTILTMTTIPFGLTNQSWMVCCTANDSFGDVLSFNWAVTNGNFFPLTSGDCVIWNLTTNGSQSIAVQVGDGKGGYDIEIRTVVW